jgi:hypothetical protein
MPNRYPEALRGGADDRARVLGPYETAYDVRRGYDEAGVPELRAVRRADPEAVWMGRRRER